MLPKENGSTSRLVVITQGSDPIMATLLSFPWKLLRRKILSTLMVPGMPLSEGFWLNMFLGSHWRQLSNVGFGQRGIVFKDQGALCLKSVILRPKAYYMRMSF